MVSKARIRLSSSDPKDLIGVCEEISRIAERTGVRLRGPIPLPTKKLLLTTRKSPCGEGTNTWDRFQLRIHKRLVDVDPNERFLKRLMRIKTPESVLVEIELV